jgi:hypothetical protein
MAGSPLRHPMNRPDRRFTSLHTVASPYRWSDISHKPSGPNRKAGFITDMCRPALGASRSGLLTGQTLSLADKSDYESAETTIRVRVPRIKASSKPRSRALSPQTCHYLHLSLDSIPLGESARSLPFVVHSYARPNSRRSPVRAWQRREEVKNRVIEDYLGRFERKRGPNLALPQEQPRPLRLTRMVSVSVQQSGGATMRQEQGG